MQTQEISKITINGLFHKYDVTVDLSKDCTILIGSNGIGKSTVLKLIKYLLSGMIMDVATVPFDSIVIDGCAMQHEDFLIPTHILETLFCELNGNAQESYAETKFAFRDMIEDLRNRDMLGDFLCELYYTEEFSLSISAVVEKYLPCGLVHRIHPPVFISTDNGISAFRDTPALQSEFVKKMLTNTYWHKDVFYFDMVQKVQFPSHKELEAGVYSKAVTDEWYAFNADGNLNDYLSLGHYNDELTQQFVEELKCSPITYKYGYSSHDIDRQQFWDTKDVSQQFMIGLIRLITKKGIFDINSFLNLLYYDPDFVSEVNEKMITYLEKYYEIRDALIIGTKKVDIKGLINKFDSTLTSIHELYIRPILIRHSIFDVNLERLVRKASENTIEATMGEIALLLTYKDFYDEIFDGIISEDNMSQNIRALKDLLSQYLIGYNISITPKGISLYSQVDDCGFSLNEDVTIFRSQNEIRLEKLSSGESKIIALCFLALCSDYAILILDEPELSISIIWQEKLLVDLLDYGTFTSIVVATHSPYIARHETLSEYINYLP